MVFCKTLFVAVCAVIALTAKSAPVEAEIGGDSVAQVHEYISNENCKNRYIIRNAPTCVGNGECYPVKTDAKNNCTTIELWQWQNHETGEVFAAGVLPIATKRVTHTGSLKQKIVWTYVSDITQGEAVQNYNIQGSVTVQDVLNTPTNHISMISNMYVNQSKDWFKPGANNSGGCGQKETLGLPFGFNGSNTDPSSYAPFIANLTALKQAGVTITLTMGSWCTQFPVNTSEEWSETMFGEFVDYFKSIRQTFFGGNIDGIDWDWEGFCTRECLKGACTCGWDDDFCGQFSPEELAMGQVFGSPSDPDSMMCYIMPTKSTVQVMAGITYYMKKAGFLVTAAPMSTAVYTDKKDTTAKSVMRNEFIKYGVQPYPGGKSIDGDKSVNFLQMCDGILLQWYSGYDASLCKNTPEDPMACACNNVPDADYPNVINISNDNQLSGGQFTPYYGPSNGSYGQFFPSTFHVRCQACGKNVILPDGSRGDKPCFPTGEDWFYPCNETQESCWQNHTAGMQNYRKTHNNSIPYFWPHGMEVNSKCPRALDCPDFQYTNEPRYASQVRLLQKLASAGIDLNLVSIGYETMGVDIVHQWQSFRDPVNYFPTTNVSDHDLGHYFDPCTTNMTKNNVAQGLRCASSITHQHWGPKFNATDIIGLEAAVRAATGKDLAGVGTFTLDGMMWTPEDTPIRYWFPALMLLNETYMIPCHGDSCGGRTPVPGGNRCNPEGPGGCNVCAACCQTFIHTQADCDACVTADCNNPPPVPSNFCGITFSDAQANCKTATRCVSQDSECAIDQHCYNGITCSGPPPPPPGTKNFCGTSWSDANTNCATAPRCVSQDSECPSGDHCYTGIINCPSIKMF